jgi:hypothetical protein
MDLAERRPASRFQAVEDVDDEAIDLRFWHPNSLRDVPRRHALADQHDRLALAVVECGQPQNFDDTRAHVASSDL